MSNPLPGFMGMKDLNAIFFFLTLAQNAYGFFGSFNNRPEICSDTAFRKL